MCRCFSELCHELFQVSRYEIYAVGRILLWCGDAGNCLFMGCVSCNMKEWLRNEFNTPARRIVIRGLCFFFRLLCQGHVSPLNLSRRDDVIFISANLLLMDLPTVVCSCRNYDTVAGPRSWCWDMKLFIAVPGPTEEGVVSSWQHCGTSGIVGCCACSLALDW
jgi:hypothetical protein